MVFYHISSENGDTCGKLEPKTKIKKRNPKILNFEFCLSFESASG